jgi:hypothetical protein
MTAAGPDPPVSSPTISSALATAAQALAVVVIIGYDISPDVAAFKLPARAGLLFSGLL